MKKDKGLNVELLESVQRTGLITFAIGVFLLVYTVTGGSISVIYGSLINIAIGAELIWLGSHPKKLKQVCNTLVSS